MIQLSLPPSIEFYHLGTIEAADSSRESPPGLSTTEGLLAACNDCPDEGIIAVSLRPLTLTSHYLLLTFFPEGFIESFGTEVDPSARLEFANVIASRVADDLTRARDGNGVMITPPDVISRTAASRILSGMRAIDRREYARRGSMPVKAWILSAQEESGNV